MKNQLKLKLLFIFSFSFSLIIISDANFSCKDCEITFDLIYPLTKTDVGFEWLKNELYKICIKENGFNECQGENNCKKLCNGMIRVFAPEFKYILSHSSSNKFCNYFGFCSNKNVFVHPILDKFIKYYKSFKKIENNSKLILQLTDLHLTQYYQIGSITNCGLPVCCYNDSEPIQNVNISKMELKAGVYGDYHCDSPQKLFDLMLDDIEERFTSKFNQDELIIIWTGDTNSHRLWNQTQEENINHLLNITNQINKRLRKYGHLVISNYGNHDTYPINQFNYPDKQGWLFNSLGLEWGKMMVPYLSNEGNMSLLSTGNFVINLPFLANVSIISLNTNYFDSDNYWNLQADNQLYELFNQSDWFNNVLEKFSAPIYLVGHIPFGSTNLIETVEKYQEILTNYSYKIKGAFFGHHHTDQFEILHQSNNLSVPIIVLWSAPAMVPDNTNPSYRLYEVSNQTGELLNYYQYRLTLPINQQSIEPIPKWYLAYDYKSEYQQNDLYPESVQKLVYNLNSSKLFDKFERNYFGGLNQTSNKKNMICDLSFARKDLKEICQKQFL